MRQPAFMLSFYRRGCHAPYYSYTVMLAGSTVMRAGLLRNKIAHIIFLFVVVVVV